MVKKYKYFFIAILLILLTPMTTSKINNYIAIFNTQQNEYDNFVESFIIQIEEVQDKNPVDRATFEAKGEMYIYDALSKREKVLNSYNYTEDMVPDEYIDIHRQIVDFIVIYKEGIDIVKEGLLLLNTDRVEEGLSKITAANELLYKMKFSFILKQSS